jgi:hypothetical protein
MSSLPSQIRLSLKELTRHIPPSRNGKSRHYSTVFRYATRGVRGIKLQTERLPDGLYTTIEWWEEFVRNLTSARASPSESRPPPTPRKASVDREIDELRKRIRRGRRDA